MAKLHTCLRNLEPGRMYQGLHMNNKECCADVLRIIKLLRAPRSVVTPYIEHHAQQMIADLGPEAVKW